MIHLLNGGNQLSRRLATQESDFQDDALAADLATATKLREAQARAALSELRGTGHLIDVRDGFGVERIAPTAKVTHALVD